MRVLLVKPNVKSDGIQPVLGLGYLAAQIRQNDEVKILNCIKETFSLGRFKRYLADQKPEVIGLQVQLDLIIGHPGETEREIEKSLKKVLAWDPDYLVWARLVPYPGTRVAGEMKARTGKERLPGVPWSSYQKQIKSAFGNLGLTPETLGRWQIRGYVKFYLRPGKILNLFRIVRLRVLFLSVWFQIKKFSRGVPLGFSLVNSHRKMPPSGGIFCD